MLVEIDVRVAELKQPVHLKFCAARGNVLAMVGIGEVGGGRRQQNDLGTSAARMSLPGRSNEERKIFFSGCAFITVTAADMQRIRTAAEVGGQHHVHAGLPAQVVNVVVVEMDAAVLLRALPPV